MATKPKKKLADQPVIDNQASEPEVVNPAPTTNDSVPIKKPSAFSLEKFKVKRAPTIAVNPLHEALTVMKIAHANDFVRLHPDEEAYWSDPLCFVSVPIKGTKKENLHLIDEDLATAYLSSKNILRYRLALASKPFDVFFLCIVPTTNLDNKFNETALQACEQAKTIWVKALSRKDQGHDDYLIQPAKSPEAFPEPKWPTQSLAELLETTFKDRMIDCEDHPGLLRLIGDKQKLS